MIQRWPAELVHIRALKWSVLVLLAFCSRQGLAQYKLQFIIRHLPAGHAGDSVFVAGNFNGWNPGEKGTSTGGEATIQLNNLAAGSYNFKFTRGSWQSVECLADGRDISDRQLVLSSDTMITTTIEAWKDDFAAVEKKHTASPNVSVMDAAFPMPQLNTTRRIWIYLPPGYHKSKKRYPVMYMQDGQNIFDAYTAGFDEWGADEAADSLVKLGKPPCIIIGIDNGPHRLNEYNPYEFKDFGKGEGDQYVDFLVQNLKPFIDRKYRTLKGSENTIIAGSSMGGLISYYAMLKYPDVFGKGGIFSPSFWTAGQIKELTATDGKNLKGTLFFYIGGQEGDRHVRNMFDITEMLGTGSSALIYTVTDPRSQHNEAAWRKWFPEFYNWVLANGFNNIIKVEEEEEED